MLRVGHAGSAVLGEEAGGRSRALGLVGPPKGGAVEGQLGWAWRGKRA